MQPLSWILRLSAALLIFSFSHAQPLRWKSLGNLNAPKGGVLRLRSTEPPSLNPIITDGHGAVQIQFYIIEPLLIQNPETNEWEPSLAESWKVSKDQRQFEFTLREGVTWSDGVPLTVQDVKFSFDVLFDSNFPTAHMRPYYENLEKVKIIGPRTVRFYAKNNYFGNFISSAGLPIVPKHIYGDPKVGPNIHETLIGTGPYVLSKFTRGRNIVIKRNPNWWGLKDPLYKGKYNPDEIVFQFVGEDTIAIEMLKRGELDYVPLSPETYLKLTSDGHPPANIHINRVENLYPQSMMALAWNLKSPLFNDRHVRVAMTELMDRKMMAEKFMYGLSIPATGPWYQQSDFADPHIQPIVFDPKKALADLRGLGWEDSDGDRILDKKINQKKVDFKFTILTVNKNTERILTLFKEDAKAAGVDVRIRVVGWTTLMKLMDERKFDAIDVSWGGGLVEFDPKPSWHSSSDYVGGLNFVGYHNTEADHLIDQARSILYYHDRIPVMRQLFRVIAADVPFTFLFNDNSILYAYSDRVEMERATYRFDIGLNYWWLKDAEIP